jgi:hypothetical protein
MFDPSFLTYIFKDHRFYFQGIEMNSRDVLTERGFLPIVAYYADQNARYLFQGMGLGIDVVEDDATLLGQRVIFLDSEATGVPEAIRAPMLLHSTLEVLGVTLRPQPIDLDPLFDRLMKGEPICAPAA